MVFFVISLCGWRCSIKFKLQRSEATSNDDSTEEVDLQSKDLSQSDQTRLDQLRDHTEAVQIGFRGPSTHRHSQ